MLKSVENQPQRILHVLGGLKRGGAETFVMNLYRKINRSIIQFDFVIHTSEHGDFYDEIVSMGGKVYFCPKYMGKNHVAYKKWWSSFFAEHPEYGVVHSHVRSTASIYLKIARRKNIKTVIHSHSTSNGKGLSSLVKRILQYPLRHTADYLFACSLESGKWLYGEKATKTQRFIVQKNVIDIERFEYDGGMREKYRSEWGLSNKNVFIHVGRLHVAKNHSFLLNAFKKISEINSNAILFVVGDGELKEDINAKIDELALNDKVRMLGSRSDVSSLLSAADCFLFPSLWEGVPLTVIEAQAAGLPCLVSDRITDDVCISELVTKLPIDNVDSWVDAVANMDFSRKDVRDKIIAAGYDAKSLAAWLENFYLGVLK